jgi:hypothetical protein
MALTEADKTLDAAYAALRGHQADYHHTSDQTTALMEPAMARVKAALNE